MVIDYSDIPDRPSFPRGAFDFTGQPKWNIPETIVIKVAVVGRPQGREGSPSTPEEAVEQSMKCIDAGACIVHYHARGETVQDVEREFHRFIDPIKDKYGDDVIFDLSIATRPKFEDEVYLAKAGITEINPVNMSLGGIGQPMKLVQAEVEMEQENGIRPEIACYVDGDIDRARAWLYDTGIIQKPGWWDLLPSYGTGGTPMYDEFAMFESIMYQVRQIRLIDPEAVIMLAGCGRPSSYLVALSILMGFHIKVGMEDVYFQWPHRDDVMVDNIKSVADTVTMANILGRRPATANECRRFAGLPER